jgi:putative Holliday junction resolvase
MSVAMPEPGSPAGKPAPGTYLGLDFGLRRIGVSVGQTATGTARPLQVVAHGNEPDWAELQRLLQEWRPLALVLGLPLGKDGEETGLSSRARAFGEQLQQRFGVAVHYNDERLTSVAAQEQFVERRAGGRARRKDASMLDAMAAAIILENWLNSPAGDINERL